MAAAMARRVVTARAGAVLFLLLLASSACSSASRSSAARAPTPVSSGALEQAKALCAKFVPTFAWSGQATTVRATTVGAITAEQERLHGQSLSPWNLLPPSQLGAECTYEGPNVPTTEGSLRCPDGSVIGVPVPQRFLVDDQGHSTEEDRGPTDERGCTGSLAPLSPALMLASGTCRTRSLQPTRSGKPGRSSQPSLTMPPTRPPTFPLGHTCPVKFALVAPARSRVWFGMASALFAAMTAGGLVALAKLGFDPGADLVVLVGTLVMAWFTATSLRLAAPGDPALRLTDDTAEIGHRAFLVGPLVVPFDRVVAVLEEPDQRLRRTVLRATIPRQFPLDDPSGEGAWLYPGGRRFFPLLGYRLQLPNFCILFDPPVRLSGVRRLAASLTESRALLNMSTTTAVCFQLASPAEATAAFVARGVPTSITAERAEQLVAHCGRRRPPWRRS